MRHPSSGQGSLEYLLLLGAGALVALIVFLLLIFLGPYGGGLFDQNLVEYEKIDLCTASDNAACSLYLNWNEGLLTSPNGFILENQSTWRTLQMDGIQFKIFCTDGLCDGSDFYGGQGPIITLEFPVDASGNECDPAPDTSTCVQLPMYMCESETTDDGSGPVTLLTGPCSTEFDFSDLDDLPAPGIEDATFQLSPENPSREVVIVSVGGLQNKNLVSVQMSMKASELGKDGSFVNEGWDDDADKLSWYSTHPFQLGSSFQCQHLENSTVGTEYVKFGCIFPPNCTPLACPVVPSNPPFNSPLEEACYDNGLSEGDIICSVGGGYEPAFCTNVDGVSSYFTHASLGSPPEGKMAPFISMDISSIKGAVFLENFFPVFGVGANDFHDDYLASCPIDPEGNPSCGQAICDTYTSSLANLEFYVLNPTAPITNPASACSLLSDAALPSALDLQVNPLNHPLFGSGPRFGYLDINPSDEVEDWQYTCTQSYDFYTPAFKNQILNSSSSPGVIFVGVRYPNPPSSSYILKSASPFSSSFGGIGMSAFYYSP